ncbi:hypothetical protein BC826DRAFT_171547 [Russula brevipes]|nr:hypothetical protein BC826DRAFT_171547 [Russula brevipes]
MALYHTRIYASQYLLQPSPHLSHPTTFNTLFDTTAILSLVFSDTSSRRTSTLDWASAFRPSQRSSALLHADLRPREDPFF